MQKNNAETLFFVNLFALCVGKNIPLRTTMYIICVAAYSWAHAVTKTKVEKSPGAVDHEVTHVLLLPPVPG